ncbi:hypothetical protein BFZC1_08980 [Lysinibacillus fusiformis ZC1]|nr:hypothetical protein BFZC1_08980 [Lysinibacillus fusiformis ZC1]
MKYGYVVIAIPKDLVPFMKENLTVATRKAILAIKEALLHLPTQYASIFIDQAVLEFGIKHVDESFH